VQTERTAGTGGGWCSLEHDVSMAFIGTPKARQQGHSSGLALIFAIRRWLRLSVSFGR